MPHHDSSDGLSDSVRRHGWLGTVRRGVRALFRPVLDDTRVIRFRERLFDHRFGVVTAGTIPREGLKLSGPSAAHAIHYEAAQPILVEQALAGLVRSRPWCSIYRSRPAAIAHGAVLGGNWTTTFDGAYSPE